ncbi:amidase [Streptomyces chiangmaiensis]|uniref:Amidase n=1 Tax=Streptomyces chiangmaiensis TaxID=766497 RepID=A0ABU7FM83_9ACTN|nr:amidase [Streptomyces chiangmaiensis]MED7825049.1 amidase [Streptomyces chiangmaiensis]
MSELHELTAAEQAAAIQAGAVSPVEFTAHYLDRIDALNPSVGAFTTVMAEQALDRARQAEKELAAAFREGAELSALHGVTIAVKDLVQVEDVRWTLGSAAFADQVADMDDHVVTRLREAGTVLLGKTNTPEFALPCYTENKLGPPTRNPWDLDRSPGGSSGGSAAAVAAGLAALGHGTDAGGSIRIPASACGLVGFKPSRGRVSNGPVDHDVTGLSVHGPLARTVADAAVLLDAMSGPMPGDVYTAPPLAEGETLLACALKEPKRLRIAGLPGPMVPDTTLHPDCETAYRKTVQLLEDAGHQVEELEMPPDPDVVEAFERVWAVAAAGRQVDEEDEPLLTPFTRYLREKGRQVTGLEFAAGLATFRGLGQLFADVFFASYDAVLTPTLSRPPAMIGEFYGEDPAAEFDAMATFMPYTPLYNITGLPAVSLPLHWNADGLPIGVMLGGRYGDEATLISLAAQLEVAAGQPRPRPGLW